MENRALWIAFFITIQFFAVLGENPFKEYFYNKYHHKGHHSSTPEEISSVSGDFDTIEHSSTGNSENIIQSSTGEFEITKNSFQDNDDTSMTPPTLQHGGYYENQDYTKAYTAIGITIGCFLVLSLCCGCSCFCIKGSRAKRTVHGRVVILNRPGTAATELPPEQPLVAQQRVLAQQQQKPMVIQQYLQPVTTQHQSQQQYLQDLPPYYQPHAVQQQQYPPALSSQTSPTQDHSHNPPESPPPVYDFPEKFE